MAAGALPVAVFLGVLCVGVVRAVEVDTLTVGRPLTVGHTLVSSGRKFALGFFQPGQFPLPDAYVNESDPIEFSL
jgi:hypothetical protein